MADPTVYVQCWLNGTLDHTEEFILTDALSHASTWLEEQVLATGRGQAILIMDLSKCPNRVDQIHQPVPVEITGSTLTFNCADCTFTGTTTVAADPTVLTWANQ